METPEPTSMNSGITEDSGLPIVLRLGLGAIGGFIGAVIAAILWGLIVFFTRIEFSFLAIGVGFLSGMGVLLGSMGGRGIIFQFMAVDFSLLGIALGYYASFYAFARDFIAQNYGAELARNIGIFSPNTISLFIESLSDLLDPYTFIWVALAVYTAWRIPKKLQ